MSQTPVSPLHAAGGAAPPAPAASPSGPRPVEPLRLLREHIWLLVVVMVIGVGLGVVVWLVLQRHMPRYASTSRLMVTGELATATADPSSMGSAGGDLQALEVHMNTQVTLLRSTEILDDALKNPDLRNKTKWFKQFNSDPNKPRLQEAREALKEMISAGAQRRSNLINVSVNVQHPEDAQLILNTVVNTYLLFIQDRSARQYDDVREAFRRRRDDAQAEYERILKDLKRFEAESKIPLDTQFNDATASYRFVAKNVDELRQALQGAVAAYQGAVMAQQNESFTPEDYATVEMADAVRRRDEQIRVLGEEKKVMLERFGVNHRRVKEIDLRIVVVQQERQKEVDRLLRERLAVRLDMARKAKDNLASDLEQAEQKLDEARQRMRDLQVLMTEKQRMLDAAESARERRNEAEALLKNLKLKLDRPESRRVHLVFQATEPELTFPKSYVIVPMVTILLVGVVAGIIFLKELVDQRVKSPADLRFLSGVDLLGVIPDAREDPSGKAKIENTVLVSPNGLLAESFRLFRAELTSRLERKKFKTLMITCAQAGDGASTVLNNLALSLAFQGKRVLVIDANLRRPTQHELLRTAPSPGLVEVLQQNTSLDDAIVHLQSPDMDVLPAGQVGDAPLELLEGEAFRRLLMDVEARYDLVLLDTAPVLVTSDAKLLAKLVDACVLVTRALSDTRGMVARMARQLEGYRAEVLGIVLNGARSSRGGYFRESYKRFYMYQKGQPGRGHTPSSSGSSKSSPGGAAPLGGAKPAGSPESPLK